MISETSLRMFVLWKKLEFPLCLHYSLINRTSHWILVSMFSCKLAIDKSRLCLCVRVNRCSGSGESTGLEGLGWLRGSSMGVCEALCDMLACKKGYTNTF